MACLNTSQKIWVQEKVLAWKRQKDFWIGRILHLLVPKFFSTRSDFVAYVKVGFCSQQVNFFWIRSKFAFFGLFWVQCPFYPAFFASNIFLEGQYTRFTLKKSVNFLPTIRLGFLPLLKNFIFYEFRPYWENGRNVLDSTQMWLLLQQTGEPIAVRYKQLTNVGSGSLKYQ